jgi:hypothetical protein
MTRSIRTVVVGSISSGALSALLLLTLGYDGPHMHRMYVATSVTATLVALITACALLARGGSRTVKLKLLMLAVPLLMMLVLALMMPIEVM